VKDLAAPPSGLLAARITGTGIVLEQSTAGSFAALGTTAAAAIPSDGDP
jgi:hypothetical protein